jgi:predicted nucleotidyltransferase
MADEPMRLREVVPDRLAAQVRALGGQYGIRNIRIFGSFARGEARSDSDLDLLVEYVPGRNGFAFVEFCERVEALLGRRIDVVTENSLHPLVRDRILGQAVPL